jgi:hypothetical protein
VSELFYSLAILACPVAMGGMMWFMMRGNKRTDPPQAGTSGTDAQIASLRAELDQLRAAQRDRESPAEKAGEPS